MREPLYTTHQVAQLIQVDSSTISKWVDKAILPAYRTPGGHRRVRRSDLRTFLESHRMPVPPEIGAGQLRLLVVDDEKAVGESLKRALRTVAPELLVTPTTSAIEAVLTVAEERPDAVLVDLGMPEMDGLDFCREVRRRKALDGVKLVTMTARLTAGAVAKSQEAGALECLGKPVDPTGLLRLLGLEKQAARTG
jgi:excisionase family DNA binding protein